MIKFLTRLDDEEYRDNDPDRVYRHKVAIKVEWVWVGVSKVIHVSSKTVKYASIKLSERAQKLSNVAERRISNDGICSYNSHGTIEYGSNAFHCNSEGVRSQVSRVGVRVFPPQVSKNAAVSSQDFMIEDEVAFENNVSQGADQEPSKSQLITQGKRFLGKTQK